ncbi:MULTISPECIES: nitronate monooxygenase [unclassified Staphylococcus]|uniref:NAD(P)H-dependent flavin oxidoreductase n=1 Tax=unclassified Staphylococcus TaxID=91994 RepID=UPI0021D24777|nr:MULTISPECIES: nitronate monooxygenase [unclassified Staphylococcus]UXR78814.1 nitronate monooxygenase [Staphylococcus sp. IVB6227]UXR82974.1 nitronate monooxygenase [Staphylococcus sp. IVB6214]
MWYQTAITEQCGIQLPIIQAGMAGSTTPELVASVSEAGGLGTIGAGYMTPEKLTQEIQRVKQLTSKPFAVNLFVPESFTYTEADVDTMNAHLHSYREALSITTPKPGAHDPEIFQQLVNVVVEQSVAVCAFTFGVPTIDVVSQLHDAGIVVVGSATTVAEAQEVERMGMDAVVAQGSEAGGHRAAFQQDGASALVGTMALVPQIVDHVKIPVIAAGGIMDGRGWVASHVLGAAGVQLGTAFLTTKESASKSVRRQAILNSVETDTVVTKVLSGKAARGIRNGLIDDLESIRHQVLPYPIQNDVTKQIRATAAQEGNADWTHIWSGQGARLARDTDVKTLMNTLLTEAQQQVDRLNL